MKKCPTCEKTYEDSMRFCQVDGTSLVDDTPFDPYATIVARPQIPAEEPAAPAEAPVQAAEEPHSIAEPDDVLDLPDADPLKTMYVSDEEMKAAMGGGAAAEPEVVDIQPIEEPQPAAPEPPKFSEPEVPAPSFGDMSPPPSPFGSPFAEDAPVPAPAFDEKPVEPSFDEAATVIQSTPATFEPEPVRAPEPPPAPEPQWTPPPAPEPQWTPPPAPVEQWTPPAPPEPSWQNQNIGPETPFQPPMAGVGGQNKTLAIVSLVCGILSLICCSWFVPGIAAIVMGFIARGKAKSNPAEYGGEGLALGGIITGAISVVLGIIVIVLYLAGAIAGNLGNF